MVEVLLFNPKSVYSIIFRHPSHRKQNRAIMPSNPKKGKTLKCSENLKDFYENDDEFKFHEGKPFFTV